MSRKDNKIDSSKITIEEWKEELEDQWNNLDSSEECLWGMLQDDFASYKDIKHQKKIIRKIKKGIKNILKVIKKMEEK